ncbi:hypothetical protein OsJ_04776 [Oryza sativa Japonica Group]|uniref:Uncharacterized protein n=1 Tax=Oryza sativa subsp. japonica TaxID=39947 RepID=A3A1K1_ORYSJ|nr:hypothetical protein OsJ_04776 [Oryza sativa Japonica Group]
MDGTLAPLLLLLLLFLPALLLYLRRRPAAASRINNNHCPHPNPVLGNALPFLRNRHRFLDWATDLLAAAPTSTIEVRGALGLGSGVATANPAVVDHFLRASFPNYVKGARFAVPFEDLLGRGLFAADGRLWALQRKLASYSFSSRSLRRFSARVLRAHLHRRLVPLLDAAAGSGEAVDLQDVLGRFGFDNICNVAFGVESSTLLEGGDRRHEAFFAAFDAAVEISVARVFHPTTLVWRAMRLANVGSERRMRDAIRVIDEYVMAIVASEERLRLRRGEDEREHEQHLLSRFAASMEEEGGELAAMFGSPGAKRRFLRDVVVSFVMAGKDSTSSALTWLFWLLAANPRCERRVHEEVSSSRHADPRRADAGEDGHGDGYDELRRMHYLHAAISEAMRLYPPVPIDSRVAVAADALPDGTAGARRVVRRLLGVRDGEDAAAVGRRLPRVPAGAVAERRRRVRGGGRGEVPGVPRGATGVPREGDGVRADEGRGGRRDQEVRGGAGPGAGEHGDAAGVRGDDDAEDEGRATGADQEAGR